jgi:hypothetical protein
MKGAKDDWLKPTRDDLVARLIPARWRDRPVVGIAAAMVAWLPLLGFSAAAGAVVGPGVGAPLVGDVGVHPRLLVALPLFLVAGVGIRRRLALVIDYLADSLFRAFDEKWAPLAARERRGLFGDADPSSLADYGYTYQVVNSMRLVPLNRQGMVRGAALALVPFVPLLLTKYSVTEVLGRPLGIVG